MITIKINAVENVLKNKGKALVGAILLGVAVIGSAFIEKSEDKPVEKKETTTAQQFRFYNLSGAIGSMDPNNFEYVPAAPENCEENLLKECSALWTVELPTGVTAPSPGDKPNNFASYTHDGGAILGEYQP